MTTTKYNQQREDLQEPMEAIIISQIGAFSAKCPAHSEIDKMSQLNIGHRTSVFYLPNIERSTDKFQDLGQV